MTISKTLIRRLRERILSEPTVDMDNIHPPIRPRTTVSKDALEDAAAAADVSCSAAEE